MAHVRERPPLRLSIDIETPSGRHYRWAEDDPDPANVPSGLRESSTMPGGFETFDCVLPRKSEVAYSDLERLSTITVKGAGGELAGEYRLERAPRVSGNQMAVSPSAVGHQAHLEDDKSAAEIYIDRDLGNWQDPSTARRLAHIAASNGLVAGGSGGQDGGTIAPGIVFAFDSEFVAGVNETGEQWYYGNGVDLGELRYDFDTSASTDADWLDRASLSTDDLATTEDLGTDHNATDASDQSVSASTTGRKYARVISHYPGADTGIAVQHHSWLRPRVLGNHDLTPQGTAPDEGFFASDVIAHALAQWAPQINFTAGVSIAATSFVIPQLAFREPTTVGEIIRQANRFHLNDWAVWEGKTFYYHPRGDRGRAWRARIAPAQLEEAGPQMDRLWNGVIVRYQDVDGTTKTVGPPDYTGGVTDSNLEDTDPENPANALGIKRWELLDMGGVSTQAGAIEVGRRFLIETKALDRSGRARLVGYVEDDRGVVRPAWQVRAGDTISFVDASDTSARRIVRASYDHPSRTCEIDIDAPPEGLDALLERLNVVIAPLGI